jgi:hypothetical protein
MTLPKFGSLAVDPSSTSKMPVILPGEIDTLKDESGQESYIEFLPWDSEPGRALDRKQNSQARLNGFRQRSRAELLAEAESVDNVTDQAERLSALATGWHLVGVDRRVIDVEFSKANALELFKSPETAWIRRQAWVFVANEANFMKNVSKPSSPSPRSNSETAEG